MAAMVAPPISVNSLKRSFFRDALRTDAQHIEAAQYIWKGIEDANDQPVKAELGKAFIRDHTAWRKSTADMARRWRFRAFRGRARVHGRGHDHGSRRSL